MLRSKACSRSSSNDTPKRERPDNDTCSPFDVRNTTVIIVSNTPACSVLVVIRRVLRSMLLTVDNRNIEPDTYQRQRRTEDGPFPTDGDVWTPRRNRGKIRA